MPNVLHLIDPVGGGDGALSLCAAAAAIPLWRHEVWSVGPSRSHAGVRARGVCVHKTLPAPGGLTEGVWRGAIRARNDVLAGGREPDMVVCSSVGGLGLARIVFGRAVPRLAIMAEPACAVSGVGALRRGFALEEATILCVGGATAASWRSAGAVDVRTADPEPASPASEGERAVARCSLGIRDDEIAVLLLADHPALASARRFAFILGLLYTTGSRVVGLVTSGTGEIGRAVRFTRAHGHRWGLLVFEGDSLMALDACDIALCDISRAYAVNPSPPPSPLLTAGAQTLATACTRGPFVVAPTNRLTREMHRGGWPLTLAGGNSQIDLAAALLPLATRLGRVGGRRQPDADALQPSTPPPSSGRFGLTAVLTELYAEMAARAPGAPLPERPFVSGLA